MVDKTFDTWFDDRFDTNLTLILIQYNHNLLEY